MDTGIAAMLAGAGVLGGAVNALAGGATLITFPAMLMAGLAPIIANASNAVAISPGHLLAALADRRKLPAMDGELVLLILISILGGAIGALLLLALPERLFTLPVPALIGFTTWIFAYGADIQAWMARRPARPATRRLGGLAALLASCVYGGFFGAGLGIILTAMLAFRDPDDIRKVKALKNLLATCVSLAAIPIFVVQGAVDWAAVLPMLLGALAGGYLGGYLIRVLPADYVRRFVILAGIVMTLIYADRYWL